ncbi:hypothetical protein [Acidicapsa ligni]|uniref:hypothetical protein n=1 Tax=Acidicapsa ligni TaxID=542300 RepID=UPI0021E03BA1|nr:hypothetical protein [Acidicapsa ligni]
MRRYRQKFFSVPSQPQRAVLAVALALALAVAIVFVLAFAFLAVIPEGNLLLPSPSPFCPPFPKGTRLPTQHKDNHPTTSITLLLIFGGKILKIRTS